MKISTLAVRFFQIIFGAVVLGLSITAIKWQAVGSAPATTSYGAFAGAFGLLAALIGAVVVFVDAIPDLIMAIVDGLAALILLAGGIAFAVDLRGVSCSNTNEASFNSLLNGGCVKVNGQVECAFTPGQLSGRCRSIEADTAFLFLGFIASLVAAALCFLSSRRGGSGRHSTV